MKACTIVATILFVLVLGDIPVMSGANYASSLEETVLQDQKTEPGSSLIQSKIGKKTVLAVQERQDKINLADNQLLVEDEVSSGSKLSASNISYQAAVAELLAMTLFVVIGCGSAMGIANEPGYAWVLQVSLTFGFAITALAYSIGHISGGQINCAVTFGLVIVGKLGYLQGLINLIAQLAGSLLGAGLLCVMYPEVKDRTGGLGSNGVGEGWSSVNALVGEILMTFLLVFVVLETAVNEASAANRAQACVAIGLAVFLAHSVLVPVDGCSINPTRSFGPAVMARIRYGEKASKGISDMWVFWVGPLVGATLAAGVYLGVGYMTPTM